MLPGYPFSINGKINKHQSMGSAELLLRIKSALNEIQAQILYYDANRQAFECSKGPKGVPKTTIGIKSRWEVSFDFQPFQKYN